MNQSFQDAFNSLVSKARDIEFAFDKESVLPSFSTEQLLMLVEVNNIVERAERLLKLLPKSGETRSAAT